MCPLVQPNPTLSGPMRQPSTVPLAQVLEGQLRRIPSFLARQNNTQLWSILYMPQVGYVLQVSGDALSGEAGCLIVCPLRCPSLSLLGICPPTCARCSGKMSSRIMHPASQTGTAAHLLLLTQRSCSTSLVTLSSLWRASQASAGALLRLERARACRRQPGTHARTQRLAPPLPRNGRVSLLHPD